MALDDTVFTLGAALPSALVAFCVAIALAGGTLLHGFLLISFHPLYRRYWPMLIRSRFMLKKDRNGAVSLSRLLSLFQGIFEECLL